MDVKHKFIDHLVTMVQVGYSACGCGSGSNIKDWLAVDSQRLVADPKIPWLSNQLFIE
jgi:hypothetical protein